MQGVYFRFTAKAVADQLGVKGIVKNMPDGSVYIEAQGEDIALNEFLAFCNEGPEKSQVEDVKCSEEERSAYINFEIIRRNRG